jgi:hypothetical protein
VTTPKTPARARTHPRARTREGLGDRRGLWPCGVPHLWFYHPLTPWGRFPLGRGSWDPSPAGPWEAKRPDNAKDTGSPALPPLDRNPARPRFPHPRHRTRSSIGSTTARLTPPASRPCASQRRMCSRIRRGFSAPPSNRRRPPTEPCWSNDCRGSASELRRVRRMRV